MTDISMYALIHAANSGGCREAVGVDNASEDSSAIKSWLPVLRMPDPFSLDVAGEIQRVVGEGLARLHPSSKRVDRLRFQSHFVDPLEADRPSILRHLRKAIGSASRAQAAR